MAKKSSVAKDLQRREMSKRFAAKRADFKARAADRSLTPAERFEAQLKLNKLPRDSSPSRARNRCGLSGRPRGVYRKFMLSRIALRELSNKGLIPGVVKSSW